MNAKYKYLLIGAAVLVLLLGITVAVSAVSGAAFTTFNAAADGSGKDVCKNTAINCNIYGAKQYVWLNGGPTANGLGPDGEYFFAVLVPGGQPNPNDGSVGVLNDGDKNLSDDYDAYTNRIFTVTNGEVSDYSGTHDFDSGTPGNPKVDDSPPYIRLFPYADTTNNGGVYILAICSLDEGYPVDPRDCKYDAFKVQKGKMEYSFYLSGYKVEDLYADGFDSGDPGLEGWKIIISGTGPDGLPIYDEVYTDANGFWEWYSDVYTFSGKDQPMEVTLTVCEELQDGWTQSDPGGDGCHHISFTPGGFDPFMDLNFANWRPVDVTACKVRDLDADETTTDDRIPVSGWEVSLTKEGTIVETQKTGENGCYTWPGLTPGFAYDVHEGTEAGWEAFSDVDFIFERSKSGASYSHTFVNAVLEGCTPGFWQGGPDKPDAKAGGALLWDGFATVPPVEDPNYPNSPQSPPYIDPQWLTSGGSSSGNPYIHVTPFSPFFTEYDIPLDGTTADYDMFQLVDTGGGPQDWRKAARDLVAAYLNSSWGMNYPYSTAQLSQMWADAVASGDFMSLHTTLDAANNSSADVDRDGYPDHSCPISAGGF